MEGFTVDDLRTVVELSSVNMGVFDDRTGRVHSLNKALREKVKLDEFYLDITTHSGERMYGRLKEGNLPASLRVLSGRSSACLVEVYLAHAKDDSRVGSDVVELSEMTSDGVWEWFPSLNYEFMSKRFWSILGYDYREMPSSPDAWTSLINPADLMTTMSCFDTHVNTKGASPFNVNVAYTHANGQTVQVKCRGAVVEWLPDGTPWRVLGTHTDITNITEAAEAKVAFVSRMSHEIRTPVCAILNECEVMAEENGHSQGSARGGEVEPAVIEDSCNQLLSLCNNILTLEKVFMRKVVATPTASVSAREFLRKAVRRHSREARKKGVRLGEGVVMDGAHPPRNLMMDVSKCNQVVDNLIGNAIKYTQPAGSVSVSLRCRPKAALHPQPRPRPHDLDGDSGGNGGKASNTTGGELEKDQEQDAGWQVDVVVKDTGLGIHPKNREAIFDRFEQANSSMQGAGLGLSISRELARLMLGDVTLAHTEPGKGSTFVFSFSAVLAPAKKSVAPVEDATTAVCKKVAQEPGVPKSVFRVLSVDDIVVNRKIMRRKVLAIEDKLMRIGAEGVKVDVVDAVNGLDAVMVFRDALGKFNLVFMDCLMPEMDGFEAARTIHCMCDEWGITRVPIVAVTASVSSAIHQESREAGMMQVVTKPFDSTELLAVFTTVLGSSKGKKLQQQREQRPQPIRRRFRSATLSVSVSLSPPRSCRLLRMASAELTAETSAIAPVTRRPISSRSPLG